MFRLNRLTDYAVVILAQLALRHKHRQSATQLSEDTGIPLPTVAKILNLLAHGGLVDAQRGASGGYAITASAEDITVASIIEATEGPIALTACVDTGDNANPCESQHFCPMSGNWDRLNTAIYEALTSVSLADMIPNFIGDVKEPPALQGTRPLAN